MSKKLTKKERKFVNEYAESGNGVQSALKAYDTTDYATAGVIAVENLEKPKIIDELKKLGFDSNNAKRVVGQILNAEDEEPQHRLNAADKIFKVNGDYAPEKHVNVNVDATPKSRDLATRLINLQ